MPNRSRLAALSLASALALAVPALAADCPTAFRIDVSVAPGSTDGSYVFQGTISTPTDPTPLAGPRIQVLKGRDASADIAMPDGRSLRVLVRVEADGTKASCRVECLVGGKVQSSSEKTYDLGFAKK